MSIFVASAARSEIRECKVNTESPYGPRLVISLSDGGVLIFDYDAAVELGRAIEDFKHEATNL